MNTNLSRRVLFFSFFLSVPADVLQVTDHVFQPPLPLESFVYSVIRAGLQWNKTELTNFAQGQGWKGNDLPLALTLQSARRPVRVDKAVIVPKCCLCHCSAT